MGLDFLKHYGAQRTNGKPEVKGNPFAIIQTAQLCEFLAGYEEMYETRLRPDGVPLSETALRVIGEQIDLMKRELATR